MVMGFSLAKYLYSTDLNYKYGVGGMLLNLMKYLDPAIVRRSDHHLIIEATHLLQVNTATNVLTCIYMYVHI